MNGVSEVVAANTVPLSGEVPYVVAEMEDHPLKEGEALAPLLWAGAITPEYFQLMGIPLLRAGSSAIPTAKSQPGSSS